MVHFLQVKRLEVESSVKTKELQEAQKLNEERLQAIIEFELWRNESKIEKRQTQSELADSQVKLH